MSQANRTTHARSPQRLGHFHQSGLTVPDYRERLGACTGRTEWFMSLTGSR